VKFVVDMNLSPAWCSALLQEGWEAVHWSEVGDPRSPDEDVLSWAAREGSILLTHDLDFSAILAATQGRKPSVVQVRTQDVLPSGLGPRLIGALRATEPHLRAGALVVVDEMRSRVRILPLAGIRDRRR
jgi:predicted nuclease of predicted toxin-antitoxin system